MISNAIDKIIDQFEIDNLLILAFSAISSAIFSTLTIRKYFYAENIQDPSIQNFISNILLISINNYFFITLSVYMLYASTQLIHSLQIKIIKIPIGTLILTIVSTYITYISTSDNTFLETITNIKNTSTLLGISFFASLMCYAKDSTHKIVNTTIASAICIVTTIIPYANNGVSEIIYRAGLSSKNYVTVKSKENTFAKSKIIYQNSSHYFIKYNDEIYKLKIDDYEISFPANTTP